MYSRGCALRPMRLARRVGECMIDREAAGFVSCRGFLSAAWAVDGASERPEEPDARRAVKDTHQAKRLSLCSTAAWSLAISSRV